MESINYNEEVKKILKDCIEPKLKNEGFKKNKNTFYRLRSEFIDVCNVQFGGSSSKNYAYFTYNIRIALPSFYEKFDLNYDKKIDCSIIDYRFGTIMGFVNNTFTSDYWYKLGNQGYDLDYEKELVRNASLNNESQQNLEDIRKKGRYINLLEKRYDKMNIQEAKDTVVKDLDNILIQFYNKMQSGDDLVELISAVNINSGFERLFLVEHFIEKGEISKGLEIAKDIYNSDFFKSKVDKYFANKGLSIQ